MQGPLTQWVTDHRKHHAFTDVPGDPHSPHVDHGHGWRGAGCRPGWRCGAGAGRGILPGLPRRAPGLAREFTQAPICATSRAASGPNLASGIPSPAATEAVLLAQIPQTARVNKKQLKGPDVAYQGEPQFAPIESTRPAA